MSEIKDLMPLISALLKAGDMPSADQVRRMIAVIDWQQDEIEKLRAEQKELHASVDRLAGYATGLLDSLTKLKEMFEAAGVRMPSLTDSTTDGVSLPTKSER